MQQQQCTTPGRPVWWRRSTETWAADTARRCHSLLSRLTSSSRWSCVVCVQSASGNPPRNWCSTILSWGSDKPSSLFMPRFNAKRYSLCFTDVTTFLFNFWTLFEKTAKLIVTKPQHKMFAYNVTGSVLRKELFRFFVSPIKFSVSETTHLTIFGIGPCVGGPCAETRQLFEILKQIILSGMDSLTTFTPDRETSRHVLPLFGHFGASGITIRWPRRHDYYYACWWHWKTRSTFCRTRSLSNATFFHFWSRDVHPVQNLLLCTKFHRKRMIFRWWAYADITIFKMVAVRHLGIVLSPYETTHEVSVSGRSCLSNSCQSDRPTQIWILKI